MQFDPQQYVAPNSPPPKSNKKMWIILGVVSGVTVLLMGGCGVVALLIGFSSMGEDSVSPGPSTTVNTATRSSSAARSGGLAGSWNGNLQCDNGESVPAVYKVSESGYPIYEYQTRSGQREVELTAPGQSVRFVPPEGGVVTAVVDSISAGPDRVSYRLSLSGERTSGGTLDQSRGSFTADARLSGAELSVEMTVTSESVVSQPGIVVPGDESTTVCRGRLSRP